jgi:hypothetical protein
MKNYLGNGHGGVLALGVGFRKLLDHEQITVAARPHANAPESHPIETTVAEPVCHLKQMQYGPAPTIKRSWAHVDQ